MLAKRVHSFFSWDFNMLKNNRHGFTLIEMAIVLTIISLVVSGIFIGQSLVRDSQLRAVATETARYIQAVSTFRDKELALPGDFSGATALWGSTDNVIPSDAGCISIAGQGSSTVTTATCDGNGDGRITTQGAGTTTQYEQFRAWQHLANTGLIDGKYSGVAGDGVMKAIIGGPNGNVPASQLIGAGYSLISMLNSEIGANTGTHYYIYYNNDGVTPINYLHMLQFGAACTAKSTLCPIITPIEAQSIDAKLDDGYPSSGKIMGPIYGSVYSGGCTTNTVAPAIPSYDQTQTGRKCSLLFLLGF